MKFTTTATLLTTLLTTATALPWSFKSANHGKQSDEITLHLTLDKPTAHHHRPSSKSEEMKMIMGLSDICLRVCWPESPQCPTDWYAKNMGSDDDPCWTCCRSPDNDL
ncbi:hypothetical protein QBC40DRAFT_249833 [Triangularia verruculosa]|uniref:Uncharacterized protein n=1 Tax=Triangularia verruculosa TaxID=2587418 RepID=A0AAN6XUF1_9PEZI|nr:hypothetical protein QBC40DRAFT_249833 [Triangularia verruculosa]